MADLKDKFYRWLRLSESFFKADMVYVAKGTFWVAFGQVFTSLLSLLLIIVVANWLPKETYGLYRYILSLAGILNIFTLTGMSRAVSRAAATGNEGAFAAAFKYLLKWNLILLLAFWILSGYYFFNDNRLLALSLFILSFFSPLTIAFNIYSAYLDGKKEFRLNNIFSVFSTAIYVLGMIAAVIFFGTVTWLIAVYALTTFASSLIFYLVTVKLFRPPKTTDDKSFLKYGRELTFIGFIGPVASQIDKIILSHFWGPIELAVYSLATTMPERATSFIKGWVSIAFPKLATKTPEEINTVFYKRILQGLSIGAIMTLGYIILSPYVFKYLLPQYLDALFYSQILAISFVFAMPNRYVSLLLESQKMSRIILVRGLIQSLIMVLLYIVLGIWGGILGLVVAQVINSFSGVLVNIILWRSRKA